MSTHDDAARLADWLSETPGTPPPDGLDTEVVEAIYALRPDRAPPHRVTVESVLSGVREGPFSDVAAILQGWLETPAGTPPPAELPADVIEATIALHPDRAPAHRVTIDDVLGEVSDGPLHQADVVVLRPWWKGAGVGVAAVAATVLLFVGPISNKAEHSPAHTMEKKAKRTALPPPAPATESVELNDQIALAVPEKVPESGAQPTVTASPAPPPPAGRQQRTVANDPPAIAPDVRQAPPSAAPKLAPPPPASVEESYEEAPVTVPPPEVAVERGRTEIAMRSASFGGKGIAADAVSAPSMASEMNGGSARSRSARPPAAGALRAEAEATNRVLHSAPQADAEPSLLSILDMTDDAEEQERDEDGAVGFEMSPVGATDGAGQAQHMPQRLDRRSVEMLNAVEVAKSLLDSGEAQRALEIIKTALEPPGGLASFRAQLHRLSARAYTDLNQPKMAEEAAQRAAALDPAR